MTLPIRINYRISKNDKSNINKAKKLEKLGIIKLEKLKFKECKCGMKLYQHSFSYEQISFCSCCGERIREGNFNQEEFKIDKINYNKIIDIISKKIKTLDYSYIKTKRVFKKKGDYPVFLIIPEISTCNYILSENGGNNCIFVLIDLDKTKAKLLDQWKTKTFSLLEFLEKKNSILNKLTDSLSKYKPIILNNKFEDVLKRSPIFFEKKFIPFLLSELKNKDSELKSFLLNLKTNQDSLVNSKVLIVGGPSNPDFIIINLYRYLSDGLKPEKYGEAKRYTKSKFTISDYGIAIAHSNEGENLMILSTDNIQNEVWMKVIDTMRINKYFKNVILDKDLVLTLINILNIDISKILK